jgi:RNA methyltransferase, TrmH family
MGDSAMLSAMGVPRTISSRQNPLVAEFRAAAAHDQQRVLLDGPHLLREALGAGLDIEVAAFAADLGDTDELDALRQQIPLDRCVLATRPVLHAMSPARTPSGVVALARRPSASTLAAALGRPDALLVAAVDVQDPGNTGAIVRAAEAGGATAVVTTSSGADPFGWKALRGAMGSAFRLPLARVSSPAELIAHARSAGLQVVAAIGRSGVPYYDVDLKGPTAVLLGAEGTGLPAAIVDAADLRVSIPMAPQVESLNVAVTAALLVYEARRQRLLMSGSSMREPPPLKPSRSAKTTKRERAGGQR